MVGAIGLWIISVVARYLLFSGSHLKAWAFFRIGDPAFGGAVYFSKIGKAKGLETVYALFSLR